MLSAFMDLETFIFLAAEIFIIKITYYLSSANLKTETFKCNVWVVNQILIFLSFNFLINLNFLDNPLQRRPVLILDIFIPYVIC